jgi:hypothetical protein
LLLIDESFFVRNIILSIVVFFSIVAPFVLCEKTMAKDYHNQLLMENRPADWKPPFPDKEFSFSRFKTSSDFNDYLVEYGGARKRIVTEDFYQKENPIVIKYYKWTWQGIVDRLFFSPNKEAFAVFYFDNDLRLVKSYGDAP